MLLPKLRYLIKKHFGFSGTEANGFIVLASISIIFILTPFFVSSFINTKYSSVQNDNKILDSLVNSLDTKKPIPTSNNSNSFNPNTASFELLISKGFSNQIANRIINYRLKGGVFKIKSDLLKIYNIDTLLYKNIYNAIDLPERSTFVDFKKEISKININKADTLELKRIKGIGSILSNRIIKYKNLLGGYTSLDQLYEVYQMDSNNVKEVKKYLYIDPSYIPAKIIVNKAVYKDLLRHPYINQEQAYDILNLKKTKGNISKEDFLTLKSFSEADKKRLIMYLQF